MEDLPAACRDCGSRGSSTGNAEVSGAVSSSERRAEYFGRDVDDGNDPLVGHARRADDADDAHHFVVGAVRRRDHAARRRGCGNPTPGR